METLGRKDFNLSMLKTTMHNNMKIQLWYSEPVSRWRWTLTSDEDESIMESGDSVELRDAMADVAVTVEWLLDREP